MPKKNSLIYKAIPGYPDYYACSNGKIYSVKKSLNKGDGKNIRYRELTAFIQPGSKYLSVSLVKDKSRISMNVHKLIGWAFTGYDPFLYCYIHKRKNYLDNRPANLTQYKLEYIDEDENHLNEIELKEFESLFKRAINYDYRNKIWNNYEVLKLKGNKKLQINFIKIYLTAKKIR